MKKHRYVMLLYVPAYIFVLLCMIGWPLMWMFGESDPGGDPWWVPAGFWFFILLNLTLLGYLSLCYLIIDEWGIASHIPGSRRGNGFISWENVRAAGVFRTPGGERLMFVSAIPRVWEGRRLEPIHRNNERKHGDGFSFNPSSRGEGVAALRRADSVAGLGEKTRRASQYFCGLLKCETICPSISSSSSVIPARGSRSSNNTTPVKL